MDSFTVSALKKSKENQRKSLLIYMESRKSIEDFLREVDEDLLVESLSSRRFCHHGRQIAEEVWIDNGVFGAKF